MAKRSWNDEIRQAIKASGLSLNGLATRAGIDVAPIQRFMAGNHGMTINTAEKVAPFIGLELRRTKPKSEAGK